MSSHESPPADRTPLFSAPPYAPSSGRGQAGSRFGLVLSGGGVRGAYEVGVVEGIIDVLGIGARDPAPFGIFAGSSVGAINAAFLAGHAGSGDMGVRRLRRIYERLELSHHVRPRWPGVGRGRLEGPSLLDPAPLEALVRESLDWPALHAHVRAGRVRALTVAALDLADGRTTIFAEMASHATFRGSEDPRRRVALEPITAEHVLASAAIPLVFPARRVGGRFFADGGVRFNTPLSPAIRAGATRLVVVTVGADASVHRKLTHAPGLSVVASRLLTALLSDPVRYELQVLGRLNRLLDVIEENVTPEMLATVQHTLIATRGAPYRRVEVLEFSPSADLAGIAERHVRRLLSTGLLRYLPGAVRRAVDSADILRDPDWATYLLFDGGFASEIHALGHADALARADAIRAFFGEDELRERKEVVVVPDVPAPPLSASLGHARGRRPAR